MIEGVAVEYDSAVRDIADRLSYVEAGPDEDGDMAVHLDGAPTGYLVSAVLAGSRDDKTYFLEGPGGFVSVVGRYSETRGEPARYKGIIEARVLNVVAWALYKAGGGEVRAGPEDLLALNARVGNALVVSAEIACEQLDLQRGLFPFGEQCGDLGARLVRARVAVSLAADMARRLQPGAAEPVSLDNDRQRSDLMLYVEGAVDELVRLDVLLPLAAASHGVSCSYYRHALVSVLQMCRILSAGVRDGIVKEDIYGR